MTALLRLAVLGLALLAAPAAGAAIPTPEAEDFIIDLDEDGLLVLGFAAFLTPRKQHRIGLVVECRKAERSLKASLFFGPFPDRRPVQTAVRAGDGTAAHFGPVIRGSRAAGFHSPEFTDTGRVARLVALAFTEGALVSNGHNSVWNRIPAKVNAVARARLAACAGR